jgi:hypothetical protein
LRRLTKNKRPWAWLNDWLWNSEQIFLL